MPVRKLDAGLVRPRCPNWFHVSRAAQRPLPDGALRIVARGEKKTEPWRRFDDRDMITIPAGKFMMPAIPPGEALAFKGRVEAATVRDTATFCR